MLWLVKMATHLVQDESGANVIYPLVVWQVDSASYVDDLPDNRVLAHCIVSTLVKDEMLSSPYVEVLETPTEHNP